MRLRHAWPALLLLAPLLSTAAAQGPTLQVTLPPPDEFISPGNPLTIDGSLVVNFPEGAQCAEGLRYGFNVANHTAGLTVRLDAPNGTIAASQIRPGSSVTIPLPVRVDVNASVPAYDNVDLKVAAATMACGNLAATSAVGQTGFRVGFGPNVTFRLLEETARSWRVEAASRSNARVRVDWSAVQPGIGLLSGGSVTIAGPSTNANRTSLISVSRARLNESAAVRLEGTIVYQGDYPPRPDEAPADGFTSLTLYEPPRGTTGGMMLLQYALLAGALGLVVLGVVATVRKRRRAKP